MKSKPLIFESWQMKSTRRIPIPILLAACLLTGIVFPASAQDVTKQSAASAAIYDVADADLQTLIDDMSLKISATVHKVAVTPDLVERTPADERAKLGQDQFLFRVKISNLAEKPFYFNSINALMFYKEHPDAKSVFKVNISAEALMQPYDLENFKPSNKQRIAGWKIDAGDSLLMIITSEGDPYTFTKLETERNFTLHLTTQLNGVYMPTFQTQLPLLEGLEREDSDSLGPGIPVNFAKLEQKRVIKSNVPASIDEE